MAWTIQQGRVQVSLEINRHYYDWELLFFDRWELSRLCSASNSKLDCGFHQDEWTPFVKNLNQYFVKSKC